MTLSYTDPSGTSWSIDNYGRVNATRGGSGLFSEGAGARILAEVGSGSFTALGFSFAPPVVGALSQTVTATSSGGASYTRGAQFLTDPSGNTVLRIAETITNTGAAARAFAFSVLDSLTTHNNTTVAATDSGDTTVTVADDWYQTTHAGSAGYPFIAHVMSGGAASPDSIEHATASQYGMTYNFELDPNESVTVVHFYVVSASGTGGATLAEQLSNLPDWAAVGLTQIQSDTLVNYRTDVTADVTTTLDPYERNLTLTGSSNIDGTGNALDNILIGNDGVNTLTGLAGNDTLDGGAADDTMIGGLGDDRYIVRAATDVLIENGNEGIDQADTYVSLSLNTGSRIFIENLRGLGSLNIALTGNAGNNTIIGTSGNNKLLGLDGNDRLDGGAGTDTLYGGLGDDTYVLDRASDVVVEAGGQGVDTVEVSFSGYVLGSALENLTLVGAAITGTGNGGANILTGNAETNTLIGLGGNDTYVVQNAGDVIVEATSGGRDVVQSTALSYSLSSNVEDLTLVEGSEARVAIGNGHANILVGNSANNTLDGGAGADTMSGGSGADFYYVNSGGDIVVETLNNGTDTVRSTIASHTLAANVENGLLAGSAVSLFGNDLANVLGGTSAANTIGGGNGNDTLHGEGGNDLLEGGDGDDMLFGDRGQPAEVTATRTGTINGVELSLTISAPERASGSVTVSGTISTLDLGVGPVNVVYVVDTSSSMSAQFRGEVDVGDVNGDGSANTVLDAAIASFSTLNDRLAAAGLGNRLNAALIPFGSDATLSFAGSIDEDINGNAVADIVDGLRLLRDSGGTNYTRALEEARDYLASQPGGRNIVFFVSDGAPNSSSYLDSILPELRALGDYGTIIRAIGTGSGSNEETLDILDDGLSNDSASIVTNPADLDVSLIDTIVPVTDGAWVEIYRNNVLVDIVGPDRYRISPFGISFDSVAIPLSPSGTDQISARLITSDIDGATITTPIAVSVGSFVSDDTLVGGAGNDTLNGGAGSDVMTGGIGNDLYFVNHLGDVVTEVAAGGIDTVHSALVSYTLAAEVEDLVLIGAAVAGTGNDLANRIYGNALANTLDGGLGNDLIEAGDGDDRLTGGGGRDTLRGGAGADTLNGADGAGYDALYGGLGDDVYYVDQYDIVDENNGTAEGIDTIHASVSTSLGGSTSGVTITSTYYDVENLILVEATAAINGVGNDSVNVMTGNSAANTLFGLGGNDTLIGGGGNDVMNGGLGNDTFYLQQAGDVLVDAGGIDTVITSLASTTLAAGLENLVLGAGAVIGLGNADANVITGNAAANTLGGGAGIDTLIGGGGNDGYYIDDFGDRVIEAVNAGTDWVRASVSYLLEANVENLLLVGSADLQGAGNGLGNLLRGNAGDNRLLGLGGADTLNGFGGNDTLVGGSGIDRFVFSSILDADTNVDTIEDFALGADVIQLSAAIFGGIAGTTLAASAFVVGAPTTAAHRVIYDAATGALSFDADGNLGGDAIRFATLAPGLALTSASFEIIA